MKRRTIKLRSNGYYRRERHNYIMIAIVWVAIIATCYYGVIGVKCVRHYQELMQGRVTTINMYGGDK
jgi:hypothetical protein